TSNLPRNTEAERLVVMRVGQEIFRKALMEYWNGTCPLTGITDPALLRASHVVPWAECESDALRLNVYNGLLLSSLWDAAFDAGLVSFTADGVTLASPTLSESAALALSLAAQPVLHGLTPQHEVLLKRHRTKYGVGYKA
ncbi:MAG: HNH endonuclease, partial [Acidobacteriota bacterium]|nr:HNH endonuclease [Acidobacteriota bacterium]